MQKEWMRKPSLMILLLFLMNLLTLSSSTLLEQKTTGLIAAIPQLLAQTIQLTPYTISCFFNLPISYQLHKYNREPSSAEARPAEAAITIYQAILATKLKFFSIPDNVQCAQLYYYQARGWGKQGPPSRHLPNIILLSGEKILNKICPSVRLWL